MGGPWASNGAEWFEDLNCFPSTQPCLPPGGGGIEVPLLEVQAGAHGSAVAVRSSVEMN